jgi:hypothetical protein
LKRLTLLWIKLGGLGRTDTDWGFQKKLTEIEQQPIGK